MKPLSVKAAAAELGISVALCYSLVARGAIRHERLGTSDRSGIRITPEALAEFRKSRERGEPATPPPAPAVTPPRPRPRHVRMRP